MVNYLLCFSEVPIFHSKLMVKFFALHSAEISTLETYIFRHEFQVELHFDFDLQKDVQKAFGCLKNFFEPEFLAEASILATFLMMSRVLSYKRQVTIYLVAY